MPDMLKNVTDSLGSGTLTYLALAAGGVVVLWIVWRLLGRRRKAAGAVAARLERRGGCAGGPRPARRPAHARTLQPAGAAGGRGAGTGGVESGTAPGRPARSAAGGDRTGPGQSGGLASATDSPLAEPGQRGASPICFSVTPDCPAWPARGRFWSSVAGVVKVGQQPVMAGLVLRAAAPNSLGQTVVDAEHQWLGCLRVKWG